MKLKSILILVLVLTVFSLSGCKKQEEVVSYLPKHPIINERQVKEINYFEVKSDTWQALEQDPEIKAYLEKITKDSKLKNLKWYYKFRNLVGFDKEGNLKFAYNFLIDPKGSAEPNSKEDTKRLYVGYFIYFNDVNSYFGYNTNFGENKEETVYTVKNNNEVIFNKKTLEMGSDEDIKANILQLNVYDIDLFIKSYFINLLDYE